MEVNALEVLGRLARAKENVKICQREIGEAEQFVLERDQASRPLMRPGPGSDRTFGRTVDLPAHVGAALRRAEQAVADLQTLGESLKGV